MRRLCRGGMVVGGMGHQSRKERQRARSQIMSRCINQWSYETIRHWVKGGGMMPRYLS